MSLDHEIGRPPGCSCPADVRNLIGHALEGNGPEWSCAVHGLHYKPTTADPTTNPDLHVGIGDDSVIDRLRARLEAEPDARII